MRPLESSSAEPSLDFTGPPDRLEIRLVAERSNDPVAVALADFHPIGKVGCTCVHGDSHCKTLPVQGCILYAV